MQVRLASLLLVWSALHGAGAAEFAVGQLTCEHLVDPIGLHDLHPRVSWVLTGDARGTRQTAYRIAVASTREALLADRADRWDSGKVASDESVLVPYAGAALDSRMRCWWRVMAWDQDDRASAWSPPASWEMGLIHDVDWGGRWIEAPEPGDAPSPVAGASWIGFAAAGGSAAGDQPKAVRRFRRAFAVAGDRKLESALLRLHVDDRFSLWLDGEPVPAADGDWKHGVGIDLTARLKPGRHVLALADENGGGPAGMLAGLTLAYAGGEPDTVVSDAAWKATDQAPDGWQRPDYDDAAWPAAAVIAANGGGPWGHLGPARANRVAYLRCTADLPAAPVSARLYVAALGLHRTTINGRRVDDSAFAGEWTDYRKRVRYQAYDVTALLAQGENVLGVALGDGWYSGHVGLAGSNVYGTRPALCCQLEIRQPDSTSLMVVPTMGSWRCAPSPMHQSDLLDGEVYDARDEIAGWDRPGFDASAWAPVRVRTMPAIALDPPISPPVRITDELPAIALSEPAPGRWTFDLGQNIVGRVRLRVAAPAGTKLTLRFAEMLNPDGTVYTTNLRGARAIDEYTCRGGGAETWEPTFTFHGFRYVEVTGLPAKPALADVTGVVIGSDLRRVGTWTCSDERLNRLYANIVWGQRGNYLSVPTDCPQRDERCGWMGDAQVFVRTAACSYDIAPFFAKWLVDVDDAQTAEGAFPDIAPRVACGDGTPAWAEAGVICPWTVYRVSGDRRILEDHYPAMARSIASIRDRQCDHLIRVRRGSDYGDWLSIGADTDKEVIGTACFAYATGLVARAAEALGKADEAAAHRALFADIRRAFAAKYVKADGTIHNDTQCAYLMALRFGLVDGDAAAAAKARLAADIRRRDIRLATGFVGVSYLLPVLTAAGEDALAWQLLEQDAFPSWLFSVKHGATTIWERWDGWTPERGFQDAGMNSFNHYSLGSCGEWMFATAAGIELDPAVAGWRRIVVRPRPGGTLSSVAASYDSPYGRIASGWSRADGATTYAIAIPANATAEIHLPAADDAVVREGDVAADAAPGVRALARQGGEAVFAVGGGDYRFVVR